ncbi:uncharacterized protein LOC107368661 [Tetranychus urticae]|uniref:uncharacterized protein LOC107368661 n=1 Tax=Tetranychus urticae TaxID=32264 RepID=UPI00077C0C46|nr:uncharacterized protein LOC107368661 [Tetranychus urticae]
MDVNLIYFVFILIFSQNIAVSTGQSFTGDCQILYQCQSEAIKLTTSKQNTGYHGLGLAWSSTTCGVIRQKLACVVNLAQTCSLRDDLTTKSTSSIVDSTKNYLIEKCSKNRDWSDSSCFQSPEVTNCLTSHQLQSDEITLKSCSKYNSYKKCILNHVNSKCSYQEREYVLIYLIEKASNLTWLCTNESAVQPHDRAEGFPNPFGNHIGKRGSPNYDQNDDHFHPADNEFNNRANGLWLPANRFPVDFNNLNTGASQSTQNNPFNSGPKDVNNQMNGDAYYQPINSYQPPSPNQRPMSDRFFGRPPLHQLPNEMYFNSMSSSSPLLNPDQPFPPVNLNKQQLNNQQPGLPLNNNIDRIDSCLQRANMIGRHCEEALNERRDSARESRNPRDLKSGLCCGLLRYSDCFGKIVNQVCPNIDATSVYRSIPENRRQEMNSCQSYGPFNCNYMSNGDSMKLPRLLSNLFILFSFLFIIY